MEGETDTISPSQSKTGATYNVIIPSRQPRAHALNLPTLL